MSKFVTGMAAPWASKFVQRALPKVTQDALSSYQQLLKSTVHVPTGEMRCIKGDTNNSHVELLGVLDDFYNCVGIHLRASHKEKQGVFEAGLVHFNEPGNSLASLEKGLAYFKSLHDAGNHNVVVNYVRNSVCASDQTGWVTRQKAMEAMQAVESLVRPGPWKWNDTLWVGDSNFIILQSGKVRSRSPSSEWLLRMLEEEKGSGISRT